MVVAQDSFKRKIGLRVFYTVLVWVFRILTQSNKHGGRGVLHLVVEIPSTNNILQFIEQGTNSYTTYDIGIMQTFAYGTSTLYVSYERLYSLKLKKQRNIRYSVEIPSENTEQLAFYPYQQHYSANIKITVEIPSSMWGATS